MYTPINKTGRQKPLLTTESAPRSQSVPVSGFPEDNRSTAAVQRKLQEMADQSPQVQQLAQLQVKATNFISADSVIQRVINDTAQPTSNTCWAATGYAIHQHKGGTEPSIASFVASKGKASTQTKFNTNKINDIDQIIGSGSNENLLTGCDDSGSYGKGGITAKLKKDEPIVANLDGNHYVILKSSRIDKGVYKITYMDPATGTSTEAVAQPDPVEGNKITKLDNRELKALYYTG